MKLLTKSGLNFISASIFFFLFGSLGGYYFIRYAVDKFLNNELLEAKAKIELLDSDMPVQLTYADVSIDTLSSPIEFEEAFINDTVIRNPQTGNYEFYRKLCFDKEVHGQTLRYCIIRPSAPSDLMVMKFTLMLTVFPVLFFLILYFVNRESTKYSLSVFYDTIKKLRAFDVNKDNRLELMTSDVDEFEQLNEVFNSMGEKIKQDFERLKEYTENTSHELQTPLAIITSKLDELLQASNLTEEQIKTVAGLMETTNRLSKINQALIYLAKLDNRMFAEVEDIKLINLIREQLELLEPMIEDKALTLELTSGDNCNIRMNRSLAHTLIQNLLKNAIRHNVPGGFIKIDCQQQGLTICNSGVQLSGSPDELFKRFKKSGSHPQSLGIGLSVVKRICDISNIDVLYSCEDDIHSFELKFRENNEA
ncbi:sensor histidine kinase [Carboxylicivirga sp. N1Y90]|uniref:sensor histidine kinase n=1 Tax=Carboxylicivirga fragile TaxID=3417571 RepID=UPI003D3250BB|nr:HAMP domain-containing histidine kinase [Marinilabiliaceae bacterium N1Y90]